MHAHAQTSLEHGRMGNAVRDSPEPAGGSVEFVGNGLIELELGDRIGIGWIVLGTLIESEISLRWPSGGRNGRRPG